MAFIASVFAYGNVKQINHTLNRIVNLMNNKPYEFIINYNSKTSSKSLKGLKHRFYTEKDIAGLFQVMNLAYNEFASLSYIYSCPVLMFIMQVYKTAYQNFHVISIIFTGIALVKRAGE